MIERIRFWWHQRKIERATKVLHRLMEKRDPEIYGEISKLAGQMASVLAMTELNRMRINHCRACPSIGPLRVIDGFYWCLKHGALKAAEAKRDQNKAVA